ncbi:MAG: preprotein translocase subunit SecG [Candidatus Marinimicrobia bacterium]|nr:preprotein translocase subunit SecG [Candidatus Neomarinimicrobiota bacterium]
MYVFLVFIFVIVALLLIASILMQSSKGGGLAGAFGGAGGGANAVFGGRGAASFLSKATQYLAIVFFVLTILINLTIRTRTDVRSVVQEKALERAVTPASALPKPEGINIVEPTVPVDNNSK